MWNVIVARMYMRAVPRSLRRNSREIARPRHYGVLRRARKRRNFWTTFLLTKVFFKSISSAEKYNPFSPPLSLSLLNSRLSLTCVQASLRLHFLYDLPRSIQFTSFFFPPPPRWNPHRTKEGNVRPLPGGKNYSLWKDELRIGEVEEEVGNSAR